MTRLIGARRVASLGMAFLALGVAASSQQAIRASGAVSAITFSPPSVVDPVHTYGEPDIALDLKDRVYVSGPTGTGTQRSLWYGSSDGGRTYRSVSQQAVAPSALLGTNAPPGGGDTEIVFDNHPVNGYQGMYFSDLYALACFRVEASHDGGATTTQSAFPGGCAGNQPTADRQWQAVFDPPAGVVSTSPYTGAKPLIYLTYNGGGAYWNKSTDGTTYSNADGAVTHFGNDGYPAIDQVTGKVFEAAGSGTTIKLNIGTPDSAGNLTFLDDATGGTTNLITIATGLKGSANAHFPVVSMDSARNLIASWNVLSPTQNTNATDDQVFVSAASAASGWKTWTAPVQVSDGLVSTGDAVNTFSWNVSGGPGRADVAWYGSNQTGDPNVISGEVWNLFMNQVVFPVDGTGAVTGAAPSRTGPIRVSPFPMHFNDVCDAGTGCILQQGNRNLADFFKIAIDSTGAAEIVYDDTSNQLCQAGFTPGNVQVADHCGAPVVTVIRQNSGLGLYGTPVTGASAAPQTSLSEPAGRALYPVIGGTALPSMDVTTSSMSLSGSILTVTMKVTDLTDSTALTTLAPGVLPAYVTRWVMATPSDATHPYTIFYASMTGTTTAQTFAAGPAQSVELCSVSACFPHVITYPESAVAAPASPVNGAAESGSVSCPSTPSATNPCTITISVNTADVGAPTGSSLLQEIGAYSLATSHPQALTTNAQAQAENVPLEIGGVCCYNYGANAIAASSGGGTSTGTASSGGTLSGGATSGGLSNTAAAGVTAVPATLAVLTLAGLGRRHRRRASA